MVARGTAGMEARRLQGGADGERRPVEPVVGGAVDQRDASRRVHQPQQHPQRGGLTGPVGAEEAGDGARLHVETEVVDGSEPAEALRQALDREGRHGHSFLRWDVTSHARKSAASTSSARNGHLSLPHWNDPPTAAG